jgi:hypothetical protein
MSEVVTGSGKPAREVSCFSYEDALLLLLLLLLLLYFILYL